MTASVAAFHQTFLQSILSGNVDTLRPFLVEGSPGAAVGVYRNNIYRAAMDNLERAYPATRSLLGAECFADVARSYFQQRPPRCRTLVGYGDMFPSLVGDVFGAAQHAFIKDVARLDRAWLEAHQAPDAKCLSPGDLMAIEPEVLVASTLSLHPSVRMVPLEWSVFDVWIANRLRSGAESTQRSVQNVSEVVLIWRHDHEVRHMPIDEGCVTFLESLTKGEALGTSAARGLERDARFDPAKCFARSLSDGLFARDVGATVSGWISDGHET